MALTATFYVFSKRENSTKVPPVGTTNTQFSVDLKEGTNVTEPTFLILPSAGITVYSFNYVHVSSFNRYYFIREWRWMNGIWEIDCICDLLATYKTAIGNSTEYVLRSASNYNGSVIDTLYPIINSVSTGTKTITAGAININVNSGYYVVGVISPSASISGAVAYYAFTYTEFNQFKQMLLSSASWTNVQASEISEDMLKTIFNPFQYIVSCRWFPSIPAGYITSVAQVKFGWWDFTCSASIFTSTLAINNDTFTVAYSDIPKHPKASTRGNYLNKRPFTEYYLIMAPYGIIEIPDNIVGSSGGLTFVNTTDFFTGDCTLSIFLTSNLAPVITANGKIGVDIQIAQVSSNPLAGINAIGQGIGAVAGNILTGNAGGAIMNAITGIASAVEQSAPTVQTGGGTGAFSDICKFGGSCYLSAKFYDVADEDVSQLGRPLCQAKQISTLSGYIKVADADIAVVATLEEQRQIKAYMENGFFYE
ncbi:MAG: hypothetical protein J6Q89_07290 [Clostridia bacterium]|nr:hypothetical protein [Clostridia bacterium]MBO7066382.1 hypothetical protein [Alphaproteobacteria bacterium]